jgi:ABC-2 type transport system permease protein
MSAIVAHTGSLTARHLRFIRREPAYLMFTLAQPMVWLLLFSQLFERVVDIPGFAYDAYVTFLTPGVVVMTAVMTANWAGTSFIDDMERGVMDRSLASPVNRVALVTGNLSYHGVVSVVQTLIVFVVALLLGGRFDGGVAGVAVVVALALLLSALFAALSCAMALLLRSQEALIGMSQMLALPLVFLSSVLIAPELMPAWMNTVATFNPVDWAAVASREALLATPDWSVIASRAGLLFVLGVATTWFATRAFGSYQRSL